MNYRNRLKARTPEFAKKLQDNFGLSDLGVLHTLNRINTTLGNFSEREELGDIYSINIADTAKKSDFSSGVNDSAQITTVDITDITLVATYKSMIPAFAIDKGLKTPAEIVEYQTLVSLNAAGGVAKGDEVVNPFSPISPELDLSISGTESEITMDGTKTAAEFGFPIAKKRIIITDGAAGTLVGQDLNGDGVIYWSGTALASAIPATVDYETGVITFASAPANTWKVKACADTTYDSTGETTLKLKRAPKKVAVEAESNRIIFEDSIEDLARMNKMVLGANFGKIALKQVLNAMVYTLNNNLVKVVYNQAVAATPTPETFDITGYDHESFADTKNDLLLGFILRMSQRLQDKSNFEPSYILVGSSGATILKNDERSFVIDANATKVIDGYIGTFAGMPVYRSQYVSLREAADSTGAAGQYFAHVIMGHRSPDGSIASAMYAEYLPIFSSARGINWENPAQYSQLLFNQSKSVAIVDNLITFGKIKFSR